MAALPSALRLRAEGGVAYSIQDVEPSLAWSVGVAPISWAAKPDPRDPHRRQPPASIWQTGPVFRLLAGPATGVRLDAQVSLDLSLPDPHGPDRSLHPSGTVALGISVPFGIRQD